MTKTWLMRRAVRRPVADGGDGPHQLVGMQAALHQELALACADQLHGLRRRRLAMRRIDDLEAAMSSRVRGAVAAIFAAGPTRIGAMMPSSAASMAPRSEASSQGWTTTVLAGGTSLARAISRSYLAWGV